MTTRQMDALHRTTPPSEGWPAETEDEKDAVRRSSDTRTNRRRRSSNSDRVWSNAIAQRIVAVVATAAAAAAAAAARIVRLIAMRN